MAGKKLAAAWQNRIIGEGVERPDQLLANPSNWRIHPKHQQDALSAVLDNVGWVQRIIVNKQTGHIVDGHLRALLADRRSETEVPVLYVDLTPDEELTILATIDPLSAMAATDSAKLAELLASVQTDDAALEAVLRGVGETAGLDMGGVVPDAPDVDVDRAEELRAKWGVEYGDLWRVPSKHGGEHRILCGDSTNAADVARVMGGECAALMWTDPPYGVSYVGKTKAALTIDNDGADGLEGLITDAFKRADTALVPGAAFYVAHPPGALNVTFGNCILRQGWRLHQTLIWLKNTMVLGHSDYHFKHEPIFYGYTKGDGRRGRGAAGWYGDDSQTSVLEFDKPSRNADHPTMKPPELVAYCIGNSSARGDGVYDPFLGSGTTAVACEQLARVCYAVEISPAYVSVALERLSLMGLSPVRSDDDAQPA